MENVIKYITSANFIISVLIVISVTIILGITDRILKKYREKLDTSGKNQNRYFGNAVRIFKAILIALTVITVLQVNGINVTSLIAGLGLASAIVGLALQDILKDVIMGTHIATDKFFTVGDAVKYGEFEGIVIDFNMKNTKIKSIYNGDIITVCNRNITEITVLSDVNDISVPLSYDESPEKVNQVLQKTSDEIKKIKNVKKCVYEGTEKFSQSSIDYSIRFWCSPEHRREVKLKVVQTIQNNLDANGIKIPYNQLDVHNIK